MTASPYSSGQTPVRSFPPAVEPPAVEPPAVEPPTVEPPAVEVVRSHRRRKTVSARWSGGLLRVSIPAFMSKADEAYWVAEMLKRAQRRRSADHVDLADRARRLASRFGLRAPAEIRWVDNQQYRWGSCTPAQGTVRISTQLVREPSWVLDYVIVHELAHLHVSSHNKAFWSLVARYPLAERARGFLMARGLEPAEGLAEEPGLSAYGPGEAGAPDGLPEPPPAYRWPAPDRRAMPHGRRPADGGPADGGPADGGPADGGPADGGPAADEGKLFSL